jgi:hypothetical protein
MKGYRKNGEYLFLLLLLEEIHTSSLIFEDFGENLDCSNFMYVGIFFLLLLFFFSSLFFERSTQVFGNIDGGINKNVGAYNKGASNG